MIKDWTYIEPDHVTAARLMIAVEVLASGKGSIDERLRVASLIISEFKETDFPEELQATFREIKATLESNLVDEQASEVALKIVRLYDKIVRDYCLPSILQSE